METELRFIEHYISLLKIRYGDALRIQINLSEAAKAGDNHHDYPANADRQCP